MLIKSLQGTAKREVFVEKVVGIIDMGDSLFRRYMSSKYVWCLKKAGAQVCVLEKTSNEEILQKYIEKCDGFLFPGGADIEPALYKTTRTALCGEPNKERDDMEFIFSKMVIESGKPVLFVCRGMQMLNVSLGGTLFQDIKTIQKDKHSDFLKRGKFVHNIEIVEGTRLYDIFRSKTVGVNSIHHQAVDRIGEGLVVSAKSLDGFVEAIEIPEYKFCVGVQWHPEHLGKKDEKSMRLFKSFVDSIKN